MNKQILKKTNWNDYYKNPSRFASLTRKITEKKILNYIYMFVTGSDFSIQEMGGANSCFLLSILKKFPNCNFTIIDNNYVGIELSKKNFAKYTNVKVKNLDILNSDNSIYTDVVLSVGLIEHFNVFDTAKMIKKHFTATKSNGMVIITYPTPTYSYIITRKILEFFSLWQFHDERALTQEEVEIEALKYGKIIAHKINRLIPLTQGILVCIKK